MGEAEEFRKALISIAKKVKQKPEMTEGDVYSCFVGEGFFKALGYEAFGIDVRAQERIGAQLADYDCVDDVEQSILILEAKKPAEEDLLAYRDKQLKEKYVLPKKSCYGVLTNGHTFYLFKREGERLIDELKIEDLALITKEQALEIYSRLRKPSYEYTDLAKTLAEISKIEAKTLTEEINRDSFYEIFKLKQEETGRPTKFTMLVFKLMDLFDELMRGEKSQFLEGAYKFWERSYAHKPSKLPENWKKLQKLMSEYEETGDEIRDTKINSELKQKYVIEALKGKTISKDKEVKIKLPRSDAAVKKILKRLEEDKAILKEKPIAELEEEINERVYRLYGLDANDVKVIESS